MPDKLLEKVEIRWSPDGRTEVYYRVSRQGFGNYYISADGKQVIEAGEIESVDSDEDCFSINNPGRRTEFFYVIQIFSQHELVQELLELLKIVHDCRQLIEAAK